MAILALIVFLLGGSMPSWADDPSFDAAEHDIPQWVWRITLPDEKAMPRGSLLEQPTARASVSLGEGYLAPRDEKRGREWIFDILRPVPLHESPMGTLWGWYAQGCVIHRFRKDVTPVGITGVATLESGAHGLVINEIRDDGWILFRYAPPSRQYEGTAWTRLSYFEMTAEDLHFTKWDDYFKDPARSPLSFRTNSSHALRSMPDGNSKNLMWIKGDYHLRPLELRDDWMRVRVVMPSDYCAGKEEHKKVNAFDGWVQWRFSNKGPLIWPLGKDCLKGSQPSVF